MSTAQAGAEPATQQRTPPYAWVVLAMLAFIYIFNFLDRQLMSVLIESIKRDTGFTDEQMGYMTGFWFALFYTVFGVIVGFLADRTSRVRILFFGCFLWSLFTALCGFAKTYPTMLAARIGVGVGEAAGAPPSYSIISDYFPAEKRGLALALFSLGVPFGQALAVAFGAQVDLIWGWRTAFITIGAMGIVAAFLLLLIVREPKRGAMDTTGAYAAAAAEPSPGFSSTFWQFVSRPVLLWTALGCGMSSFVGYAALNWNAPYLIRVLGMTREELSIWYAIVIGISIGIGTWSSGALVDFLSKRSKVWYALVPCIAMAVAAPFWYFYIAADTWQTGLLILSVPLLLTIMYLAPAIALVQNSVKPSQRTMSGAILLMVLNIIGLGGGPTLVGVLSTNFAASNVAAGMETAAAASAGLNSALFWMLPFYAVAVGVLLLEAAAIQREIKAGRPIMDGGARLGIILLLLGAGGLAARTILGGVEGLTTTAIIPLVQLVLLIVATGFGLLLTFKAVTRKNAAV